MLRPIKPLVFLACLGPAGWLLVRGLTDRLGANPIDAITDTTGTWTLRFILITLAVTPLRRLSGWHSLIRLRRMLGLFAFFYASLHFTTYIWLDQFFSWPDIVKDVAKRPFITVGFATFVMLVPLALTSSSAAIRWLGGRRWQLLHRLIYLAGLGGVVHYWWLVKADLQRPQIYAVLVGLSLGYRLVTAYVRRPVRRALALGGPKGPPLPIANAADPPQVA